MVLCQLSIAPVGKDVHLHSYVKKVIQIIKNHAVNYEINDMATVIETDDLDTIFKIISEAHDTFFQDNVIRVITELKIDDRKDKHVTLGSKKQVVQ